MPSKKNKDIPAKNVNGRKEAAALLNAMKGPERDKLMQSLIRANPEMAKAIQDEMFGFEDLVRVNSKGLQLLIEQFLQSYPQTQLLLALRNASPKLKAAIFGSLSTRLSDILQNELASQKPQLLSQVTRAQDDLMRIARTLRLEGHIVLKRDGADSDERS